MANALTGFRIEIKPETLIPDTLKKKLGKTVVTVIQGRIRNAQDVNDSAATPYSARGPVYIPVVGGLRAFNESHPHRGYLNGVGYNGKAGYGVSKRFANYAQASGQSSGGYSRTGRSLKFQNWSAFKRYLGHSGSRDLEVTGKMLKSILVTGTDTDGLWIGFQDLAEEKKMAVNTLRCDQWGFSPNDQKLIGNEFEELLNGSAEAIFRKLFVK